MRSRQFPIILMAAYLTPSLVSAQPAKPTSDAKSTTVNPKKATKAIPPVAFEAHNEGSVEGAIYGDENLVSAPTAPAGIPYQNKGEEKPVTIKWDDLSGWQPNNFTSRSPSRTSAT